MKSPAPVILQILPDMHSGGVERGTSDISKFLVQSGCKVLVASSGGRMVNDLHNNGIKHIYMPCHSKNPLTIYLNIAKLVAIIRKYKVSLIHVRSRAPAWSAIRAAHITKCPIVSTFHGYYEHHNFLYRWYNSSMLKTDHVIAVSNFIKQHILDVYKIPGT